MKKIIAILSCIVSMMLTKIPIQAKSLDSFISKDLESQQEIHILADGDGTLVIGEDTYDVSMDNPLDITITGFLEEMITIQANGKDDNIVAMWGVFEEDTNYSLLEGYSESIVHDFSFGTTKMMQISFATREDAQSYYGNRFPVRRMMRAASMQSLFEKEVGYTFSGQLTIDNDDIYSHEFAVDYVNGELAEIAEMFTNRSILLHCLNPGYIAPTKNISVYGMYAPIYHTYHATVRKKENNKMWIEVYTDPLRTPAGGELKGYNNGRTVGYQTVGRNEQYGGLIELELPYADAVIEKKDSEQGVVSGAHLVLSQNGQTIDEWDTSEEPKRITVKPGNYHIEETVVPKGYIQARGKDIVVASGQDNRFLITDGRVGVIKKNKVTDEIVPGAKFVVKDAQGNVVDSWTSTKEMYYVSNLLEGEAYTLQEVETPQGFETMDPISFTASCEETITIQAYDMPKKIMASVIKVDQYDHVIRLAGAEFTLFHGDGTVATTIDRKEAIAQTDENGQVHFEVYWNPKEEDYYLMETKAPHGYCNDHEGEKIPVSSAVDLLNTTQEVTITDRASTKVQLHKSDQDALRVQGDAEFTGAKYIVYDAATDERISKYGLEDTLVIKKDGYSNAIENLPYAKTYYALEVEAPKGYLLNPDKIPFALNPAESDDVFYVQETSDEVVHGSLAIYKHYSKGKQSQLDDQAEEGAKFAVMLKKYVEQYGSLEDALQHTDEMTPMEYAVLETDEKGYAESSYLAYGTYVVKQIGASDPESVLCKDTYEYVVKGKNHNPKKTISFTNERREYALTIEKRNFETGKKITWTSAVFKIKKKADLEGNTPDEYVTQTIGNTTYDTFQTNAQHTSENTKWYFSANDPSGTVTTPLMVTAGIYEIEEIACPKGFVLAKPIQVKVSSSEVSEVTEEGNRHMTVSFYNEKAYGKLFFQKKIAVHPADETYVDPEDFTDITYCLRAKENIVDPENGKILLRKGEEYQTFSLEEDGSQVVENIPLGSYELQEVSTRDGILLNDTCYDVTFSQENQETKVYEATISDTDDETVVQIQKKDPDGNSVIGAKLSLKDEEGNLVTTFVTKEEPYVITGLAQGKRYTLEEEEAPEGYQTAEPITFYLSDAKEVHTITMVDEKKHQVQTGYHSQIPMWTAVSSTSFLMAIVVLRKLLQ